MGLFSLATPRPSRLSAAMFATAIIDGKVIKYRLSPALTRAHRRNAGKTMTDAGAVAFVERKRREKAVRLAKTYLAGRS